MRLLINPLHTLKQQRPAPSTIPHYLVPTLPRRHAEQRQHGEAKVLEIGFLVECVLEFYEGEVRNAQFGVDDEEEE